MAEIVSKQAAKIAANTKLAPNEAYGKKRIVVITSPDTAAWAQNDTIASGIPLPIGTRFPCNSFVSHAAMGTSVTLDVGIRNFATKTAIDADGIAASADVAAAGRTALNNGALVAAGVEYVTTEVCEVYATLTGANPTDDAQMRIEVECVTPD
jgi:hypothetical protein